MNILSPVLKVRTRDDAWWRTPIIDQETVVTDEPTSQKKGDFCEGHSETENVVQLWPTPISLNSLRDSTTISDDGNWAS